MAYHLQAAVPRIIGHSASGADCDQWFYHPGSFSLPRSLVDGTVTSPMSLAGEEGGTGCLDYGEAGEDQFVTIAPTVVLGTPGELAYQVLLDSPLSQSIAISKDGFLLAWEIAEHLASNFPLPRDFVDQVIILGLEEFIAEGKDKMPAFFVEKLLMRGLTKLFFDEKYDDSPLARASLAKAVEFVSQNKPANGDEGGKYARRAPFMFGGTLPDAKMLVTPALRLTAPQRCVQRQNRALAINSLNTELHLCKVMGKKAAYDLTLQIDELLKPYAVQHDFDGLTTLILGFSVVTGVLTDEASVEERIRQGVERCGHFIYTNRLFYLHTPTEIDEALAKALEHYEFFFHHGLEYGEAGIDRPPAAPSAASEPVETAPVEAAPPTARKYQRRYTMRELMLENSPAEAERLEQKASRKRKPPACKKALDFTSKKARGVAGAVEEGKTKTYQLGRLPSL